MFDRIIRTKFFEVKENLCVVDFSVSSISGLKTTKDMTHSEVYELLDQAESVEEGKDGAIIAKHGAITLVINARENATQARIK